MICLLNCDNEYDLKLLNGPASISQAAGFIEELLAQADGSLKQ